MKPVPARCALLLGASLPLLVQSQAALLFTTDFEGPLPPEFGGAGGIEGTQGYSAHGFGRQFLRNDTSGDPAGATTLTLGGLAAHTSVTLTFSLAIVDSWDGNTDLGGTVPPDFLNVQADGVTVFSETFEQFDLTDQSYGGAPTTSGSDLGFNAGWNDSAYEITLSFPHASSDLVLSWFASGAGWQAGLDESWAIDNLEVSAVPEPSTWALVSGIGLLAFAGYRRHRRA
jgi:hypothetical protein